ncbi:MAG TPA: histidine kinase [Patescibacteria group bacterium]|nr:histidine kinase [Patescibacteria group bacterium]
MMTAPAGKFFAGQPLIIRFFVFSAGLIIIPMLVVGVISYQQATVELEREARDYSGQIIEQIETHMEYYIGDFEIGMIKLLNHAEVNELLKITTAEQAAQDSEGRRAVESLLKDMSYSRPDISNITIAVDNVLVIDNMGLANRYSLDRLKHEYWYQSLPNNGTSLLVSRKLEWPEFDEPVISLVRRIYNPATLQPVGVLMIDINFRRIQELAEKVNWGRNRRFYIIDSIGHYVYHPDVTQLGNKAVFAGAETLMQKNPGAGSLTTPGKDPRLLTYSYSENLGWTSYTLVSLGELLKGATYIGKTIFGTVAVALGIAYLLGAYLAATIIRPVRRMQGFVKRVETGDFSGRLPVESNDELGQLSQGFNNMVQRLKDLLEEVYFSRLRETEASLRQKEMELKILQSQINPHFLCNSLETIRGMALDKDMDDIASMSASLSQLLRYNLKNASPTVMLREEIKFCEVYLRIQQFRFDKQVSYRFDIPEWAWDLNVVKFSLQPLVENCFLHAVEKDGCPTEILIAVTKENDAVWRIEVIDTGVGIAPDLLCQIRSGLARNACSSADGTRIGVCNVHCRIVNLYGEDYGVQVYSQVGEGTRVVVRLPLLPRRRERLPALDNGDDVVV